MKKVWIVARHEFATTVKRWGFLLVTFGLPLFVGGLLFLVYNVQSRIVDREITARTKATMGFVDEAAIISLPVPDDLKRYATRDEAKAKMGADNIQIVVVIPETYVKKGGVDVLITIKPSIFNIGEQFVREKFASWLAENVLREPGKPELDPQRVARARQTPGENRLFLTTEGGVSKEENPMDYLRRAAGGLGFFILLFVSISVAGGYLIQGMADEKENRVLEMVVSSMRPVQLMAGKLIGLGAVGLLQVSVWAVLGGGVAAYLSALFLINPVLWLVCGTFYLLGYALFGSLLLGIGSLGSNQREATQYTTLVTLLSISPLFFWVAIAAEPQGTLARVLTFIPLTTPVTMMLRYGVDPGGTPLWELFASMALLLLATIASLFVGAKLYRVGLLLYGKRPTPAEIWRWIRE